MKILHTADWHLGKRLDRFERLEEQKQVLYEICEIADREKVDAVLVAGDLFDTFNPPIEATELFYRVLKRLAAGGRRPVVAIAGNHDSPDRIEAPDPIARECGIIFAGFPHSEVRPFRLDSGLEITKSDAGYIEIALPGVPYPLRLIFTPYANEGRLRKDLGQENPDEQMREILENHWANTAEKYLDDKGVNILVAHLLMMSKGETPPDEMPEEEKPINIGPASLVYTQNLPNQIQYCALGHIHSLKEMSGGPCPVLYSSSPLAYSFPPKGKESTSAGKFVVVVDAEPAKSVTISKIPLKSGLPLVRKQFSDIGSAVEWLVANQDLFVELHVETDDFISATERKMLTDAHSRVVGPIPVIRKTVEGDEEQHAIDPKAGLEPLFRDYFMKVHQTEPDEEIMALFREVAGKENEG